MAYSAFSPFSLACLCRQLENASPDCPKCLLGGHVVLRYLPIIVIIASGCTGTSTTNDQPKANSNNPGSAAQSPESRTAPVVSTPPSSTKKPIVTTPIDKGVKPKEGQNIQTYAELLAAVDKWIDDAQKTEPTKTDTAMKVLTSSEKEIASGHMLQIKNGYTQNQRFKYLAGLNLKSFVSLYAAKSAKSDSHFQAIQKAIWRLGDTDGQVAAYVAAASLWYTLELEQQSTLVEAIKQTQKIGIDGLGFSPKLARSLIIAMGGERYLIELGNKKP